MKITLLKAIEILEDPDTVTDLRDEIILELIRQLMATTLRVAVLEETSSLVRGAFSDCHAKRAELKGKLAEAPAGPPSVEKNPPRYA